MSGQPSITEAYIDLVWLTEHDALTGVAEIIRERRRHVEQLGYTPEHDQREHRGGGLAFMSAQFILGLLARHYDGTSGGPAEDQTELAQSGALAAAEIDRLATEFSPPEPGGYRCWRSGHHTHHVHEPDQPCPLTGESGDQS